MCSSKQNSGKPLPSTHPNDMHDSASTFKPSIQTPDVRRPVARRFRSLRRRQTHKKIKYILLNILRQQRRRSVIDQSTIIENRQVSKTQLQAEIYYVLFRKCVFLAPCSLRALVRPSFHPSVPLHLLAARSSVQTEIGEILRQRTH